MNRRNFFKSLLVAGAGFAILPGAGRIWKAERKLQLVPFWYQTSRRATSVSEEYIEATEGFDYVANNTGIYQQLKACEGVVVPQPLVIDDLLNTIFRLKRMRQPESGVIEFEFRRPA